MVYKESDMDLESFTPGFREIIRDAQAAGLGVIIESNRAIVAVRRHKRTGRILHGMVLWGSGTATDPTVHLSAARGIRKLSLIRRHLGLCPA